MLNEIEFWNLVHALTDNFDAAKYRNRYPDLSELDDLQLKSHYENFGKNEGRTHSSLVFREKFCKIASQSSSILEIGPFCTPSLIGKNVSYCDIMDKNGLEKRAKQIGYPSLVAPEIDFIVEPSNFDSIDRTFTTVFSSHVIEHQIDLIGHLNSVKKVLKKGKGFYFLIIPDKRYCFDHNFHESTIAEIIEAHIKKGNRHKLRHVIEHLALITHNDVDLHWKQINQQETSTREVKQRIEDAIRKYESGEYVDVHAWKMTPSSFESIMFELKEYGYISASPFRVYNTPKGKNEFMAILEYS